MKRGFTLVELLGVIVVLAFVALITVPIVLSVINKSDDSATKRSAENYRKAVKESVARKNLSGNKYYPTRCVVIEQGENAGYLNCNLQDGTINSVLAVKMEGTIPESGFVEFRDNEPYMTELYYSNKKVQVNIDAKGVSTIKKNN